MGARGGGSSIRLIAALLWCVAIGLPASACSRGSDLPMRIEGSADAVTAPVTVVDRSTAEARLFAQAAMSQVGRTMSYDPAYVQLEYPGGDVPIETGVCTDVVVRAFREMGSDLQVKVHEDMSANFSAYPNRWGLARPDPNIDHRRVPNLEVYFEREGKRLPVTESGQDYLPGDLVTWDVYGRPHIGIVSTQTAPSGDRWLIAHNIGRGASIDDVLFEYEITGHFRYFE